jgi:hypothetical protein
VSGAPDRNRAALRPFLVAEDEAGAFSLIVRETRYNSQNFPVVRTSRVAERFASAAAAQAHARAHFGAATGEFELPPRARRAAGGKA